MPLGVPEVRVSCGRLASLLPDFSRSITRIDPSMNRPVLTGTDRHQQGLTNTDENRRTCPGAHLYPPAPTRPSPYPKVLPTDTSHLAEHPLGRWSASTLPFLRLPMAWHYSMTFWSVVCSPLLLPFLDPSISSSIPLPFHCHSTPIPFPFHPKHHYASSSRRSPPTPIPSPPSPQENLM